MATEVFRSDSGVGVGMELHTLMQIGFRTLCPAITAACVAWLHDGHDDLRLGSRLVLLAATSLPIAFLCQMWWKATQELADQRSNEKVLRQQRMEFQRKSEVFQEQLAALEESHDKCTIEHAKSIQEQEGVCWQQARRIAVLERDNEALVAERKRHADEIRERWVSHSDLEHKTTELRADLERVQLQREAEAAQTLLDQASLHSSMEQVRDQEVLICRLVQQVENLSQEKMSLHEKLCDSLREIEDMQVERAELCSRAADLKVANASLTAELEKERGRSHKLEMDVQGWLTERQNVCAQLSHLSQERAVQRQELEDLQQTHAALKALNAVNEKAHVALLAEKQDLRVTLQKQVVETNEVQQQKDALTEALRSNMRVRCELRDELTALQEEHADLKARSLETDRVLQSQRREAAAELRGQVAKTKEAEQQKEAIAQTSKDNKRQLQELKKELSNKVSALQECESRNAHLEERLCRNMKDELAVTRVAQLMVRELPGAGAELAKVQRRLLLCVHPDKCPAVRTATMLMQELQRNRGWISESGG